MVSRILSIIIVPLLLLPACLLAQEAANVSLENEFVRVVVTKGASETGRFSIRTTGGDPSRPASRDKHLIFGGNTPWTSYTTVMIDGDKYGFGGATKRRAGRTAKYGQVSDPAVKDGQVTTTDKLGDIEAVQELGFVRGTSTRMLDTIGITYRLTNTGDAPRQVGLRVMLDTMCGSNDGAPVRAASQAITTATLLTGDGTPDYWQAFDNLADPTVISQGTLRGGSTTPPNAVVFADWGTLADEPWMPELAPGQGFVRKDEQDADTAVALFWNPVTLEPGKSIAYTTYYGIGEVSLKPGQLALGLTAPADAVFAYERTQSFTITGYLQNTGGFDGRNVALSLTLPEGLALVSGDKLQHALPLLKSGETVQNSWVVRPTGKSGGKLDLTLAVKSENIEANTITRPIQVEIPVPRLQFVPGKQRVPLLTNRRATIIPIQVNVAPAVAFNGARIVVRYNPDVIQPFDVSRGRAFVEEGKLLAGWDYDDSQPGRLVITGRRTGAVPITQAEANLATINFQAVGAGKTALTLETSVLLNEAGQDSPVDISAGEVEVFEK